MPRFTILPKPGIVRGATPQMSAGRWFDANLMRWRGGQAQPVGGNVALPITSVTAARDLLTWRDNRDAMWVAAGTDTKLWAINLTSYAAHDITPSGVGPLTAPGTRVGYGLADYGEGNYGTARDVSDIGPSDISGIPGDMWSLALFGEDLLIVPQQDGRLFRWKPFVPATLPAVVPNAPTQNIAVMVTDERHVVLIGAGNNRRLVRWSDQEEPEVWAATVSNMAGDKQLETEGRPYLGRRVPGGNLIWTDNDVHLMRYVGPPYAYGITRIGAACGPISPRAISQAGGRTAWMGYQSFWEYSGGNVVPLACDVQDWLFSLINRDMTGRVFGAPNARFAEHWWYWPDQSATECNRYVALNYGEAGAPWLIGQQSRTAADMSGAMQHPLLGATDGGLYMHEYGWTDNGASRAGMVYIETGDIQLGDLGGDADRRFHVSQMQHDYVGSAGAIGYRFLLWEEPDAPVFDTGTFSTRPGDPVGLTDVDFSTRGMRVRIEGLLDQPWALGRTRAIIRPGGYR